MPNGSPTGGYYTGPSQTSIYTNDFAYPPSPSPRPNIPNYSMYQDFNGSPNISYSW